MQYLYQEIADIMGVSRRTIRDWLDIPNRNIANRYIYDQRVKLPDRAQAVILDRLVFWLCDRAAGVKTLIKI